MQEKREEARAEAAARQAERAEAAAHAAARKERAAEVTPWLRSLGFRMDEAQRGAAACEHLADAPLEERVKVALASLAPTPRSRPGREPRATSQLQRLDVDASPPQAYRAAAVPLTCSAAS